MENRFAFAALLAMLAPIMVSAQALPADSPYLHLGAASCAGSTCHGAMTPAKGSAVLQNEFFTWERHDPHSNAYRVLESEAGRRITANLGLKTPAAECLVCHSDAVPAAQQGKRYRASEGVSCEACHGGSEKWLGPHATGLHSQANLQSIGLYPLADPQARATLCLSCHQSSAARPVTHRLFGAGHPPLNRFELDTYTVTQPAHFRVDEDYRKRKTVASSARTWLAGQVVSAKIFLDELASPAFIQQGVFPELAYYDCDGCHHPMRNTRWTPGLSASPGEPRIADAHLSLISHILAVMTPAAATPWDTSLATLRKSGHESIPAVKVQAQTLRGLLSQNEKLLLSRELSDAELRDLLTRIVKEAQDRAASSYLHAAQTTLAISALTDGRGAEWRKLLQGLYESTDQVADYDPARYRKQLRTIQARIATIQ